MGQIPGKTFTFAGAAVLAATLGAATMSAQNAQGQPFLAVQAALSALQAQVANLASAVASLQSQSGSTHVEVWHLGTPYANTHTGQLTPGNFMFTSSTMFGNPSSVTNAFDTISPNAKRVQHVSAIVGNRSGTYGEGLYLAIEARGYDGSLHRVLSTAPVNLESVNQLEWVDVPITGSADAVVLPGEYRASHVTLGGAPGGSLTLMLHLRAEMADAQ